MDRYSFSQRLQTPSPRRLHFGNDDSKLISTTRIFAKKFLDTSPLPPKINTKSNAELANHTSENSQGTVKYNLRRHTEPFCDAAQAKCKVSQFDFYTTSPQFSGPAVRASKSALRVESQKFLHTWNRKVTLKPTSKARTEKIKNALTVRDSKGNEVS